MGQNTQLTGGQQRQLLTAENLALPVAAPLTVLLELEVGGLEMIGVQVSPTVQAFNAFAIEGKVHPDAPYVTLYNTAGAFTTPVGLIIAASGDLTTQAAGTQGWVILRVEPLFMVRIRASSVVNGGTTDAYAGGSGQ
jgi:hypothetical protein